MEPPGPDTFRIMIATDNHLGVYEQDSIRKHDSFLVFEEIMQRAKSMHCDFVLLGGDLFHENKPSRHTLHQCIHILTKYTLGKDPATFDVVSDPAKNFPTGTELNKPMVNIYSPQVSLPVFTIHGNHDDPAGEGMLAALDLLSASRHVNYFGKVTDVTDFEVSPVLLWKGRTKLALYGLGSVREERLYRTWQDGKIQWLRPDEDRDAYFNLLVFHQNRAQHYSNKVIHEDMLPEHMDMVIWGHEHECRIEPTETSKGVAVIQPGSSVATSLAQAESQQKKIGVLDITGDEYTLRTVALRNVRPFIFHQVSLQQAYEKEEEGAEDLNPDDSKTIERYLKMKVEELLNDWKDSDDYNVPERHENLQRPLIRLRVDYTGYQAINSQRFGHHFVDDVANPNEILQFFKKSVRKPTEASTGADFGTAMENTGPSIDTLVRGELQSSGGMRMVRVNKFIEAIESFVDKGHKTAIEEFNRDELQDARDYLLDNKVSAGEIEEHVSMRLTDTQFRDDVMRDFDGASDDGEQAASIDGALPAAPSTTRRRRAVGTDQRQPVSTSAARARSPESVGSSARASRVSPVSTSSRPHRGRRQGKPASAAADSHDGWSSPSSGSRSPAAAPVSPAPSSRRGRGRQSTIAAGKGGVGRGGGRGGGTGVKRKRANKSPSPERSAGSSFGDDDLGDLGRGGVGDGDKKDARANSDDYDWAMSGDSDAGAEREGSKKSRRQDDGGENERRPVVPSVNPPSTKRPRMLPGSFGVKSANAAATSSPSSTPKKPAPKRGAAKKSPDSTTATKGRQTRTTAGAPARRGGRGGRASVSSSTVNSQDNPIDLISDESKSDDVVDVTPPMPATRQASSKRRDSSKPRRKTEIIDSDDEDDDDVTNFSKNFPP